MKRTTALVRRVTPLLPALIASLVALQCIEAPLEPVAPFWQTQLSIPLADITRTLADAFKDTSTVKRDLGGGFYFEDTQSGQPVKLDTLKVSPQPAAEQVSIGRVEISALPATSAGVNASSFGLSGSVPEGFPFPSQNVSLPSLAVGDTNLFSFAAVDTGSLILSITNTMPMALTFNGPVVLQNNLPGVDTTTIASFNFGALATGQTASRTASLAGKLARGLLRTAPVSVTLAAATGPFSFTGAGVQLSFSSTALRVDSARALVPPQQVVSISDSVIVVDDSVSVTNARFRRGTFSARIVNNLDLQVGVRLKFGNFRSTVSGDTMSILRTIQPRSIALFPFSLDTIQLINPTPDPIGTRVRFSVGIETITSAGQKSTVTKDDFVRAEFTPQNSFVLQSITGRIKPTTLAFSSGASGLNLGEAADKFSGNFTFDSVRIAVRLGLTGGYPVRYSLSLEARNRKTNTVASLRLPPPVGADPGDTTFVPTPGSMAVIPLGTVAELNTFLSNFFPNFPDTFIVRGNVTINPAFASATIADTSKLYQAVNMYFPLKIGLANGKIEDKISLGEESKFPTDFARDIKQASLRFNITNKIPAQLGFRLRLLGRLTPGSPRDTLLRIPVDGSSRTIFAAPVDVGGNTTGPALTPPFEIGLTTEQVALFNKADTMYVRLDLQTSGAGTQAVRFRTSDFIRLRMSGNLVYIVNQPN